MSQAGLLSAAYTKGTDFSPPPVSEITYLDSYKNPIALAISNTRRQVDQGNPLLSRRHEQFRSQRHPRDSRRDRVPLTIRLC